MTAPALELRWRRLHPLSPLLRSGKILIALTAAMTPQAISDGTGKFIGWGLLGLVPLLLGGAVLSWRRTRFGVDGVDLRVESGVLLHRSRRVPLARIQAIDVVRPLIGRALGLAELRLEVVGGGKAEAPLAYLREAEAESLRLELLALARGEAPASAPLGSTPLVTVPAGALIGSTLLDARSAMPLVLLLALFVGVLVLPAEAVAALTASMLGTAVAAFEVARRRLAAEWGFSVSDSPDGLVLRHGLTETRSQTVPEGRVQGLRVIAPLLWRQRGWVRVEIDVAGYAGGKAALQTSTLLPVAPRALAEALVARVLGAVPAVELGRPPGRARWLSPLSLPVLGVGYDDRFVVTRTGWLRHDTAVVPLAKVQGFRWHQGPLQRRLRLATLHLDTAGRDIHAVALHRDADEARVLLDELSALARTRRRTASLRG